MNNQISPSPWHVCEKYTDRNVFPIGYVRPDGVTAIIAEVNSQGGTPDQQRANAELIASAPALLAQRDALQIQRDGLIASIQQAIHKLDHGFNPSDIATALQATVECCERIEALAQ